MSARVCQVVVANPCSELGLLWLVSCQAELHLACWARRLQRATWTVEGFVYLIRCVQQLVGDCQVMDDVHAAVRIEEERRAHRLVVGFVLRARHSSSLPSEPLLGGLPASGWSQPNRLVGELVDASLC